MVKVCSLTNYSKDKSEKYKDYFEKYPYELSIFQKYAFESIIEGHHVLVTAHTGSGKTLPSEFAIEFFVSQGKKVIYTGPIKALLNQKFYDFTNKYPHISFGICTGDIKFNPQADVLLMTAEILLNKLYQTNSLNQTTTTNSISFEMDFQNELACVVMDEVHYINEAERGSVWENTIMMLPQHVQMVMLSATIDQPEKFAYWVENRGNIENEKQHQNDISNNNDKIVYLTGTNERIVPLTHYSFITTNQSIFKKIKDKTIQEEIRSNINKLFVLQDAKGKFNELQYIKFNKILKMFEENEVYVKRQHVLNEVTKYMVENEMLPALCFVLSRKQLEICAKEVTTNLLEFDSKVPYIIDRECEQIIRKLPNYQEYLHLPEYVNMVALLRKGIAIHHSGIMPVLKEMVELLYSKGYIKLLFATETFSVGLNMPTKTVIYTSLTKFDGDNNRLLYSHEYSQMSGRAGRRGIDTVGHVIHLNNLFRHIDMPSYKIMMNGKPQTLVSKFKISYNLILNLIDIGDNNFIQFARKSMVKEDIDNQLKEIYYEISKAQSELDNYDNSLKYCKSPIEIINEYIDLCIKKPNSINKKRKEIERRIQNIQNNYKNIDQDKHSVEKYNDKKNTIQQLQDKYNNIEKYIDNNVHIILDLLEIEGFIKNELYDFEINNNPNPNQSISQDNSKIVLTKKGLIASSLREVNCIVFANLIENKILDELNTKQLISLFSCFTNVVVADEIRDIYPKCEDILLKETVLKTQSMYIQFQNTEMRHNINTGSDYNIQFDLLKYVEKWCECQNVEDCKYLLQTLAKEKEIFLGEFVKALLKINNISQEMEKVAEMLGNIAFLSKLKEIPALTLKYVVTNQSLYV